MAAAAALCVAGGASAAGGGADSWLSAADANYSAATPTYAADLLRATTTLDVSGIQSFFAPATAGNVIRTIQLAPGAEVTGIGWNVSVTAFAPSWLSELTVGFGSSSTGFVNLNVGSGDDNAGTSSYSSGGIIDLVGLGFNFNVGADGLLVMEFSESFDDSGISPDGIWNSGALTVEVSALPVPEPTTYGLMALGLVAIGAAVRRRKQA